MYRVHIEFLLKWPKGKNELTFLFKGGDAFCNNFVSVYKRTESKSYYYYGSLYSYLKIDSTMYTMSILLF